MRRPLLVSLAVSALLAGTGVHGAFAADWDNMMRGGFTDEWDTPTGGIDPLEFEAGMRYWYAMGRQAIGTGAGDFTSEDTAHIPELFVRIDDASTDSYLKFTAGYAAAINGEYDSPYDTDTFTGGNIGYVVADFGYGVLGDNSGGTRFGPLIGYQYWNDSPDNGRAGYAVVDGITWPTSQPEPIVPFDSSEQNLDIHALRLGVSGKAELGRFSIEGEVAAIPYASISGTLGGGSDGGPFACTPPAGDCSMYLTTPVEFDGRGYGATAEVMLGAEIAHGWNIKAGGRAWYMLGVGEGSYGTVEVTDSQDLDADPDYETPGTAAQQTYVGDLTGFELFRFGGMVELSYSF
ncbi:hypothetical protein [Cucumibacter marinus]|uniref:hypothetical protein n=1 Tax=Cucumibacter marinus TaxID=1121252 RepID=UPI0003F70142|nr:hypothetical protein [Cucumibacter marinus]